MNGLIIKGIATIAALSFSASALADSRLLRQYKAVSERQAQSEAKSLQSKYEKVEEAAEAVRSKFAKEMERRYEGLLPLLKREANAIQRSNATVAEKAKLLKELVEKYKDELLVASQAAEAASTDLRVIVARLFPFECLFDAFLSVYCSDEEEEDVVIDEDIILTSPFADSEFHMSGALIGFGQAAAFTNTGETKTEATSVNAGTFYAKAGMLEVVSVPTNVDKVKITAKIETNYDLLAFALLGVTGGEAKSYLSVFGEGSYICEQSYLHAMLFAPVAYYATSLGESSTTLACEFFPDAQGMEIVIAGGTVASAMAALPAATEAKAFGDVKEIKVQFISE